MAAIHWLKPVSGGFTSASAWSGGRVPGSGDDALLDAAGTTGYTVTVSASASIDTIQTATKATLRISAGNFTVARGSGSGMNAGVIAITAGAKLTLGGTLANSGVVELDGTSKTVLPYLQVGAGGLTLTGGGEVRLASTLTAPFQPCPPSYSCDRINGGAGARLTNVDNTIVGAGYVGLGGLALDNEAGGVIDASLETDLVLYTGQTIVNRGLVEATGAGGLYIVYSDIDNASGGVIAANGGIVYLTDSRVTGGTLTSAGAGFFYCDHESTVLDGVAKGAVFNLGYVFVSDDATLTLEGSIDNEGRIGVATGSQASTLVVGAGGATLSGGGRVDLQGTDIDTAIVGASPGATLVNIDNTISGAGQVGEGSLTLVNQAGGVIDASRPSALILDTGSATVINAGLIEATGGGELVIRGTSVDGRSGGVILASGIAKVALQGATLIGGTLQSIGQGVFRTFAGANVLDGRVSTVHVAGAVEVAAGTALMMEGAIDNTGDIALLAGAAGATLEIGGGGATLSGGGVVHLGGARNVIEGAGPATTLTNLDNALEGAGDLGGGTLTLVNGSRGVIEGATTGALTIDTGANIVVNAGQIVARGTGAVTVRSAVRNNGALIASGGVLTIDGAVSGSGAATIAGGKLDFAAAFNQHVTFSGAGGGLELARSQAYAAAVTGFSRAGATSLDLDDIAFVAATVATYAGTWRRGVLTVGDGSRVAHIHLVGNYLHAAFTVAGDGHGGTVVTAATPAAPAHRFIAAAAGMVGAAGMATGAADGAGRAGAPILARPLPGTAWDRSVHRL